MAQSKGTIEAKDQQQNHEHIGDDEVSELHKTRNFYDTVREQAERFASTRLGQFVIARGDRALRMIENTAKWSLPQEKNAIPLERPLPWMAFLTLIIVLRLTRIWLSMGALMIGNGPVSPTDLIYFIQTRRRKLRAIRLHGLKVMRQREQERSYRSGKGLTYKLSQWLSRAICRPGVHSANSGRLFTLNSSLEQLNEIHPQTHLSNQVSKRPREDESHTETDHNLTIDEMLSKYANVNSEDDSDFVPNTAGESSDDSSEDSENSNVSENGSSSSSSDEETDVVDDNKPKTVAVNGVHGDKEKHNSSTIITSNGDKEHQHQQHQQHQRQQQKQQQTTTEVDQRPQQQQQQQEETLAKKTEEQDLDKSKATQEHAGLTNTRLYNNTAAAANTDPDPDPEPESKSQSQLVPQIIHTESQIDDNDDTDCSSICTVYDKETPIEQNPQEIQQDTQTEQLPSVTIQQSNNYPTVDTLTPATSSEDIYYSPIGSPTAFNTTLGPQIKTALVQFGLAHSTPTVDLNEHHCESSDLESAVLANITQAHEAELQPQQVKSIKEPQQHQQQHSRQHNHPHQRYRGRNRR